MPENFRSNGKSIGMELFLPVGPPTHPVVLVLHGSFGLLDQYRADITSFAEELVKQGIAAVIPYYLEATGSNPGFGVIKEIPVHHDEWRRACADCLTTIAADVRFDARKIGLLGFSLGGNLALSLALDPPNGCVPRAVVDFFGPTYSLAGNWSQLPPVLICHGTGDELVRLSESKQIVEQLEAAGLVRDRDFFFETYPGEGHGFKGAALNISRQRTIEFFSGLLQDE